MRHIILCASMVLGFLAQAGAANASTISIYNNDPLSVLPSGTLRSIIDCGDECSAASFDQLGTAVIGFDTTLGEAVGGPGNSSASSQTSFVNTALGTSFATGTQTSGATDATSYSISAAYVLLHFGAGKSGLGYLLLKNISADGIFSFVYNKAAGSNGGGLSNFTTIGTYTPSIDAVPLPTAGFLLLTALGGLGLFRRRGMVA